MDITSRNIMDNSVSEKVIDKGFDERRIGPQLDIAFYARVYFRKVAFVILQVMADRSLEQVGEGNSMQFGKLVIVNSCQQKQVLVHLAKPLIRIIDVAQLSGHFFVQ